METTKEKTYPLELTASELIAISEGLGWPLMEANCNGNDLHTFFTMAAEFTVKHPNMTSKAFDITRNYCTMNQKISSYAEGLENVISKAREITVTF